MTYLAEGILGGVMGAANATTELSRFKIKELADKLRLDAVAEIDKHAQERGFAHDKAIQKENIAAKEKMQTQDIAAREKMQTQDIASREKMAADKNAALERIAIMENDLKERIMSRQIKQTDAQNLRSRIAAFAEARKALEYGASTEEANTILEAAGLPTLEEYIKEPGRKGFLGFGKKEPVIGRRIAGSGATDGVATESNLKSELDMLLSKGQSDESKIGQSAKANQMEPSKKTSGSGLISNSMIDRNEPEPESPTRSELSNYLNEMSGGAPQTMPADINKWDIKVGNNQSGQRIYYVKDGLTYRPMTDEEYNYWINAGKQIYTTNPQDITVSQQRRNQAITPEERFDFSNQIVTNR